MIRNRVRVVYGMVKKNLLFSEAKNFTLYITNGIVGLRNILFGVS